jgi:8-oxo-dGTP pyrophosphatase MutT (NUDIX family)
MEMKHSRAAGGIVIGDGGTIAMVRGKGSEYWLFPKGHIEDGESDEDAARREIQEEAGAGPLEYIDDLGSYERPPLAQLASGNITEMKEIHMFLFSAVPGASLSPEDAEEIDEAMWVPYREVAERIGNTKDKVWFASVFDRVREAIQRD